MKCPVCKMDMIVVEHKKIEVDYCTKCAGVWFDCGELELLMESEGTGGNDACRISPEAKTEEKPRKCPLCGKKMSKALIGEEPKVLIDACPIGEGLWFDGGEVNQLLSQAMAKAGKTGVVSFFGDLFQVGNKPDKAD